jgi:hypothetical protein
MSALPPDATPEEIDICNRKLTKADAEGFCESMHLCFEYNDWVRCGPCSLKRAVLEHKEMKR